MKIVPLVVLLILYSVSSDAQSVNQSPQKKVVDKKFIILAGLLVSSQVLDTETTHIGINKYGLREGNPLMAPFVNRGRLASYSVGLGIDTGILTISYFLKKNNSRFWWIPPVAHTGVHFYAGSKNWKLIMDVRELRKRKNK